MRETKSFSLIPRPILSALKNMKLICTRVVTYLRYRSWGTGVTGYWDQGTKAINDFMGDHKCNAICAELRLPPLGGKGKERIAVKNLVHPQRGVTGAKEKDAIELSDSD